MLRCLIACRSRRKTSRQLSATPSIRLTTIRTYGSMGDLARLDSSSTTPSSRNSTFTGNGLPTGLLGKIRCGSRAGRDCAVGGGRLLVDFNYAYNPYCAYNDGWSCPITPFENHIKIPIRAGEKIFHE